MLQLEFKAWNSSGGWNGMCLNSFWPKRTTGIGYGTQVAGDALFLQQEGVLVY